MRRGTDCRSSQRYKGDQLHAQPLGRLILFLDDGRLEPDTNIVEGSIRPIAMARNSLFCGDEGGALGDSLVVDQHM